MTDILTFRPSPQPMSLADPTTRLAAQTDMLIDTIGGTEYEGQPVAVIRAKLCSLLEAMGLEPDVSKVLRVATWISEPSR